MGATRVSGAKVTGTQAQETQSGQGSGRDTQGDGSLGPPPAGGPVSWEKALVCSV